MGKDKGIMKGEGKRKLQAEIESLLNSVDHEEFSADVVDEQLKEEVKAESPYDFDKMEKDFTKQSKKITDSLLKYYVDLGVIEESDYVKHKKELDTMHLSNVFFQIKTLKITIKEIMEEITSGNRHPRLMEVMGQLQEKLKSLTQMQANYMLFLEDTYKKINSERPATLSSGDSDETESIPSAKNEGEFFIAVGTKQVVNSLPETPEYIEGDGIDLIDPSNKIDLMKERNIKFEEKKDDDDDAIDVEEII